MRMIGKERRNCESIRNRSSDANDVEANTDPVGIVAVDKIQHPFDYRT